VAAGLAHAAAPVQAAQPRVGLGQLLEDEEVTHSRGRALAAASACTAGPAAESSAAAPLGMPRAAAGQGVRLQAHRLGSGDLDDLDAGAGGVHEGRPQPRRSHESQRAAPATAGVCMERPAVQLAHAICVPWLACCGARPCSQHSCREDLTWMLRTVALLQAL
jgi:hypothetical protein